jgi:hypothetical protein
VPSEDSPPPQHQHAVPVGQGVWCAWPSPARKSRLWNGRGKGAYVAHGILWATAGDTF